MDISYYKKYEPIFGSWHIVREIGEGSFGKVFEIEREDFGYTYKAALKAITIPRNESEWDSILDSGMDNESATTYCRGMVKELNEEFHLMSQLKGNSNVVSYEDHKVIEHKDEIGWDILIRMELLTPLTRYSRSNSIDRNRVVQLGIDICKALELCRKHNIVHRDIKPENIFVSDDGGFKLGDFGIAKTMEQTTGSIGKKGTYSYMAPEVYKGEPYGPRVDLYSLGIVLYRYLNNGRLPFQPPAPVPLKASDNEIAISKRMNGDDITAPANADKALADIILKACAYNPKRSLCKSHGDARGIGIDSFNKEAKATSSDICQEEGKETVGMFSIMPLIDDSNYGKTNMSAITNHVVEEETAEDAAGEEETVGMFDIEPEAFAETIIDEREKQLVDSTTKRCADTKETTKPLKNRIITVAVMLVLVAAAAIALTCLHNKSNRASYNSSDAVSDVASIYAGFANAVSLKSDGSVVAIGFNRDAQCDVSAWTDIVDVSVGSFHTVGLKSDGTVTATGRNEFGQCDVNDWTNVVAISASWHHTVGLRSDGTVVAVGDNRAGQCDVNDWTNIVAISAGRKHTIGLKSDGTVVSTGSNKFGQCDVGDWADIVAIYTGWYHTIGLKSDGTFVAAGNDDCGQCEANEWTDVVEISAGNNYTVGLKSDGTVVAIGNNEYGQCDVNDWVDIIAISARGNHTVGLMKDGRIVAVGWNEDLQCDVDVLK